MSKYGYFMKPFVNDGEVFKTHPINIELECDIYEAEFAILAQDY